GQHEGQQTDGERYRQGVDQQGHDWAPVIAEGEPEIAPAHDVPNIVAELDQQGTIQPVEMLQPVVLDRVMAEAHDGVNRIAGRCVADEKGQAGHGKDYEDQPNQPTNEIDSHRACRSKDRRGEEKEGSIVVWMNNPLYAGLSCGNRRPVWRGEPKRVHG